MESPSSSGGIDRLQGWGFRVTRAACPRYRAPATACTACSCRTAGTRARVPMAAGWHQGVAAVSQCRRRLNRVALWKGATPSTLQASAADAGAGAGAGERTSMQRSVQRRAHHDVPTTRRQPNDKRTPFLCSADLTAGVEPRLTKSLEMFP